MLQQLDPKTPWNSKTEMVEAMSERDHNGLVRYANDAGYRADVEAKIALGYRHGGGFQHRDTSNTGWRTDSKGNIVQTGFQRVTISSEEMRLGLQRAQLEAEAQAAAETQDANLRRQISDVALQVENPGAPPVPAKAFLSRRAMTAAMGSPEYRSSPRYRDYVERCIAETGDPTKLPEVHSYLGVPPASGGV